MQGNHIKLLMDTFHREAYFDATKLFKSTYAIVRDSRYIHVAVFTKVIAWRESDLK